MNVGMGHVNTDYFNFYVWPSVTPEEEFPPRGVAHFSSEEVSPTGRPSSLAFNMRRTILPERVLGR